MYELKGPITQLSWKGWNHWSSLVISNTWQVACLVSKRAMKLTWKQPSSDLNCDFTSSKSPYWWHTPSSLKKAKMLSSGLWSALRKNWCSPKTGRKSQETGKISLSATHGDGRHQSEGYRISKVPELSWAPEVAEGNVDCMHGQWRPSWTICRTTLV